MEVTLRPDGRIDSDQPLSITRPTRVILTMIEEEDGEDIDLGLASESALAKDWNRTEEDEAWAYLQEEASS